MQVVSGCPLLVVGHFQVISSSQSVCSYCFLFTLGYSRSILACSRLFQVVSCSLVVVSGCFRSFQVVLRFSKYNIYIKTTWNGNPRVLGLSLI